MNKKYSHFSANYTPGPDFTNKWGKTVNETFRTREQEAQDKIPGFNGLQQGLSHREPMRQSGYYEEYMGPGFFPPRMLP